MVASYYCFGVGGGGGKGLLPLLCPGKLHVMPRDTHWFSAGLCFGRGYLPNQLVGGWGQGRNIGLRVRDLVSSTFSSATEMGRPGKNSLSAASLSFLICQVGPLIWGSPIYGKGQKR